MAQGARKREQTMPKVSRKNKIIKMKAEVNKIENREIIGKKTQSHKIYFSKDKTDKYLI